MQLAKLEGKGKKDFENADAVIHLEKGESVFITNGRRKTIIKYEDFK